MKELERLHLGVLNELQGNISVPEEEPEEPKYGSSQACFYNCMAYIAEKFGWKCSPEKFSQDYMDGSLYKSRYGKDVDENNLRWKGTGCEAEKEKGPYAGEDRYGNGDLYPNRTAYSYMDGYFKSVGRDWAQTGDIVGLTQLGISGYILGVMQPTERDSSGCVNKSKNMHSVIIQSYSSKKKVYSYYDPTTGKYGKCSLSDMRYAGMFTELREPK